jgi:hypothetical protein
MPPAGGRYSCMVGVVFVSIEKSKLLDDSRDAET